MSLPIAREILKSRPIAYWPMQELSGTTAYDIVSGRDGTHTNTPIVGDFGLPGVGKMVRYNGSSNYTVIADHNDWSTGATGSLSVEIVAVYDTVNPPGGVIVGKAGPNSYEWGLQSGNIAMWQQLGANYAGVNYLYPTRSFVLYHLAFSVTTTVRLSSWINGSETTTTSFTGGQTNGTDGINIGRRSDNTNYATARAAHLAIYNRYVPGAEWRAHYRALLGPLSRGRMAR